MKDMITGAGAVAAALTALGFLVTKVVTVVFRLVRNINRMTDDFLGRPESAPGADDAEPGVLSQLRTLRVGQVDHGVRLRRVESQVFPNGGGSLADGVAEIRRSLRPDDQGR